MIDWRIYEKTSTIELIEHIKMKDKPGHLENANAAYYAFCFRFEEEIKKKAEIICKNNGFEKEFAIEVIQRTFKRFWKYPKFDPEKCKTSTIEKGVVLYLNRIAQNSFTDLVLEHKGINISPYDGSEDIVTEIPIPSNIAIVNNENYQIIKAVLDTFSEKHKIVYLTYLKHEINGHKLPRKLLTELREKLGISQETIRSYKNEVVNKLNEYKKIWHRKEKIQKIPK